MVKEIDDIDDIDSINDINDQIDTAPHALECERIPMCWGAHQLECDIGNIEEINIKEIRDNIKEIKDNIELIEDNINWDQNDTAERLCALECAIDQIFFDIKEIKDNIELIKDNIHLIEDNIEENEDSQTNLSHDVLSNTAQILKLEESLSNSNKNQQNINIILLITSGVCIYLSTTR